MAGTPKLIVLSEQLRGKTFELNKAEVTCGRVDDRDICIKDPTISSNHCLFFKRGEGFVIRDLGSTNGTRVNNIPITGEQDLVNSDILQLGGIEILYDCDDKTVTTVLRTQTGINLHGEEVGLSTVKKMDNVSPFAKQGGSGKKSSAVVISVVILLGVLVLVLLGVLAYMMFLKPSGGA
jgi:pSer/pThr/pTyr-binding forkhead associated (FHA) protein